MEGRVECPKAFLVLLRLDGSIELTGRKSMHRDDAACDETKHPAGRFALLARDTSRECVCGARREGVCVGPRAQEMGSSKVNEGMSG